MRCSSRSPLSARSPRQTPSAYSRRPPFLIPSVPRYRGGRRDLRHRRRRGDRRISIENAHSHPPQSCCSRSPCRRVPTRTPSWCRALRAAAPVSRARRTWSPCASPSLSRSRSRACRSSMGEERRGGSPGQRGHAGERAARRAAAARDRGLPHHLFDCLAGRSARDARGHRVRRGTAAPAARASDAPSAGTSITESVAHCSI